MKKELVRMIGSFNCHSNGHRRVVSSTSSSSTAKPFREAGAPSRSRHRLSSARQVIIIQKFIVILEMPEQTFSSQAIFERAEKLRYLSIYLGSTLSRGRRLFKWVFLPLGCRS